MENLQNNDNVVFANPEHDYHGHPNYGKVLISLLILLAVSLFVGFMFSPLLAIILIFATAIVKIAFVMGNFMHLRYEPLLIWIAVAVVAFCLLAFFWGVFPDIPMVTRDVVPR